nr:hypothetical protein [Tanacetum cinerariifolium]
MGLSSTKQKEFSSSGFKRSSSVVKSKERENRRSGCWRIGTRVCLRDMEEEVEETLVGWLCVCGSLCVSWSYDGNTGFSRARNKMEADMMLRAFSPRALRHGAEAISSYCYSGTSILGLIWVWGWAYCRLSGRSFHLVGSGPICDAIEFVGAGEGAKGMLEDWDKVVSGGPYPVCLWDMDEEVEETLVGSLCVRVCIFLSSLEDISTSHPFYSMHTGVCRFLDNEDFHVRFFFDWVDPLVCQGAMMVILGLLRVRNKMEADMMVHVVCLWDMEEDVETILVDWLAEEGAKEMLKDWDEVVSGGPYPVCLWDIEEEVEETLVTWLCVLNLVQSAMRQSLSKQEKGTKGMLEDWDEVVSSGNHPSGLKRTSLIKNPTIIMLILLFWFSKSLFVGYGGEDNENFHMRFSFDWVDPLVCQRAVMVILGLLRVRNKMEADMTNLYFGPNLGLGMGLPSTKRKEFLSSGFKRSSLVVKSKEFFKAREGAKEMLEDWDEVVSGGRSSLFVGYGGKDNGNFHMRFFFDWVDPHMCQGAMMVILGLLRARNKMDVDMMNLGLRMSLPLTKRKEFSSSGFKRSSSVVKSKGESEESLLVGYGGGVVGSGPICDATEFFGTREGGEGYGKGGRRNPGWLALCVSVCFLSSQEDISTSHPLYSTHTGVCGSSRVRGRNKMEADMMVLVQANRNMKKYLILKREKGAKGMLEDSDEVVSGGP